MIPWSEQPASLSPPQRELLELRLRRQRAEQTGSIPRRTEPDAAPPSFAQQRL